MAIRKSGISGIPFGNTAARPASPSLGQPYFNGEVGRLELYSSNGWQNIVQETPGIASATGTYNESTGSGTFIISGTNFVTGGLVFAVGINGTEYSATTSTTNSIVQMTALFTGLSAAYEPYDIKVLNPSNLFGLLPDAFYINDSPVWSTTSGSLGTWTGSSIQLAATDDESNTITYTVTSGSLPNGLSLSSSGLISGTVAANPATYTFTVSASDGINTAVTRSFSIIIPAPVASGGTLTSDSTYYYRTFTSTGNFVISDLPLAVDILVVAGGGSGGVQVGGGGGAGGLILNSSTLNAGTYVCTIGGGAASAGKQSPAGNYTGPGGNVGNRGTDSTITKTSFSTITAIAGGGGGGHDSGSAQNGGSGGGSTGAISNTYGLGTEGQGNRGGSGFSGNWAGGGGGGGGGIGGNASADTGGNGGIGATSATLNAIGAATSTGQLSGGNYYYAGGGGGCNTNNSTGRVGYGGLGGGANGANDDIASTPGLANTGGGGGGARDLQPATGGGSGIVVFRYTKASVGG
jgi:hypothetical protein